MQQGSAEFAGNKIGAALLFCLALGCSAVVIGAFADSRDMGIAFGFPFGTVALVCLALGVWMLTCHVSIDVLGITYRSMLGERHIRWADVERLYYRATRESVNFIPVGTFYLFKIIDSNGTKIRFGSRIAQCNRLAQQLAELTYPYIFNKCVDRYNRGAELDFGAIRVSRENGIQVKGTFGWRQIPLTEVHSYRVDSGHVYVFRIGEQRATGPEIGKVANAFVLIGLLDAIFAPKPAAQGTSVGS